MAYPRLRSAKGTPLSAVDHDRNLEAPSLAALIADTTLYTYAGGVATGDVFRTALEGYRYKVAASGATDHHLTTGGGVKLYVQPGDDGIYNFKAFNPAANGVTDDYAVLVKAIGAFVGSSGSGATGPAIFFPDAVYYIGSTVQLKTAVRLLGNDNGLSTRSSSATLKWPANTTGLRFNRYDTLNGVVVTAGNGADASEVCGLVLTATIGSDKTKHGIHANCRIIVHHCTITGFAGDGIHVEADSSTAISNPGKYGNANLTQVHHVSASGNGGNGVYLDGYDCNVCYCTALNLVGNGRWGLYESSFLGNTHIAHHAAGNGLAGSGNNASDQSCYVSFGGNRYAAAPGATEDQLVATTPGTDATVWTLIKAGGVHATIPLWTAGKATGTYFQGGAYWTDGLNAPNILLGLYAEGDQGPSQFAARDFIVGGLIGTITQGGSVQGNQGSNIAVTELEAGTNGVTAHLGDSDPNTLAVLDFSYAGDASPTWRLQRVGADWVFRNQNLSSRTAFQITSSATTQQMGTGAAVPYLLTMPAFGLGSGTSIRRQTIATAAPTTGAWARGDIVWNRDPSAGGFAGWICTTTGTPGTWKTFGVISP